MSGDEEESRRSFLRRGAMVATGATALAIAGLSLSQISTIEREIQGRFYIDASGKLKLATKSDASGNPIPSSSDPTFGDYLGLPHGTAYPTDTSAIGPGLFSRDDLGSPLGVYTGSSWFQLGAKPFIVVTPNGGPGGDGGDFGSRTPGTTSNGIQEAVNYAAANGLGMVYIKGGSYAGTSNVTVPLSTGPFVCITSDAGATFSGFSVPLVRMRLGYPQHVYAASGEGVGGTSPGFFTDESEVCLCFDDDSGNTLFAINVAYPGVNTLLAGSLKVNSNTHSTMGGGIRTPTLESVSKNQTAGGTFGYWTPRRDGTRIEVTIIMAEISSGSISATLNFTDGEDVASYEFPITFQSSNGGAVASISQAGFYSAMIPLWAQNYQNGGITVEVTASGFNGTYHIRIIGEEA